MSLTATLGTDLPGGNVEACQKTYRAAGTIAATGNYATGGVALTFAGVVPVPNTTPVFVNIKGISGYEYRYVKSTGKVKVFQSGSVQLKAFTAKGSDVAADKTAFVSTADGAGTAQAGVFIGNAGGGADIDFMTSTQAAAALAELPASAFPSGVTGDTITFEAYFPKV